MRIRHESVVASASHQQANTELPSQFMMKQHSTDMFNFNPTPMTSVVTATSSHMNDDPSATGKQHQILTTFQVNSRLWILQISIYFCSHLVKKSLPILTNTPFHFFIKNVNKGILRNFHITFDATTKLNIMKMFKNRTKRIIKASPFPIYYVKIANCAVVLNSLKVKST